MDHSTEKGLFSIERHITFQFILILYIANLHKYSVPESPNKFGILLLQIENEKQNILFKIFFINLIWKYIHKIICFYLIVCIIQCIFTAWMRSQHLFRLL